MVLFQLRKPASEWEGGRGVALKRGVGPGKNGGWRRRGLGTSRVGAGVVCLVGVVGGKSVCVCVCPEYVSGVRACVCVRYCFAVGKAEAREAAA